MYRVDFSHKKNNPPGPSIRNTKVSSIFLKNTSTGIALESLKGHGILADFVIFYEFKSQKRHWCFYEWWDIFRDEVALRISGENAKAKMWR